MCRWKLLLAEKYVYNPSLIINSITFFFFLIIFPLCPKTTNKSNYLVSEKLLNKIYVPVCLLLGYWLCYHLFVFFTKEQKWIFKVPSVTLGLLMHPLAKMSWGFLHISPRRWQKSPNDSKYQLSPAVILPDDRCLSRRKELAICWCMIQMIETLQIYNQGFLSCL